MKALSRGVSALAIFLAIAIVFSPLAAVLFGTDLRLSSLSSLLQGIVRPLAISAGTGLVSAAVALLLGTPFAVLVERSQPRWRRIFWALGLLALIVPPYIAAESWIVLLGPVGKISKPVALFLGLGPRSTDPVEIARYAVPGFVYSWAGVGAVMGGCLFPVVALAVASTLRRTDRRVFEAARLAQGMPGVRRVVAHILIPPSLGGALLVFAAALTEFAVPQVLRVRTIGETIYAHIQEGDLATAAALSLPLLPLVVAIGAVGIVVLVRARVASMAGLEGEIPKFEGRAARPVDNLQAGLVSFFAIIPGLLLSAISLIWLAVTAALPKASVLGSHNVLRASGMLNSLGGAWELAHGDAVRTVLLAAFAASLATLLAILIARLASRNGWSCLLGILSPGLAVPAPIIGLGLIALWDHRWSAIIYQGLAIVLLAWLARFLPLTILLVQSALARVPRELESAAALAGRGAWGRFCSVIVPNAAPGLVAAWLATYVLSATEFSATLLVAPPGSPMLAPSVVNLMRRGQDPEIAACQTLLLCVVALPLAALAVAGIARARTAAIRKEKA